MPIQPHFNHTVLCLPPPCCCEEHHCQATAANQRQMHCAGCHPPATAPPTTGPRNSLICTAFPAAFMACQIACQIACHIAVNHQFHSMLCMLRGTVISHLSVLYSRGVRSHMCYIAGLPYHTFSCYIPHENDIKHLLYSTYPFRYSMLYSTAI